MAWENRNGLQYYYRSYRGDDGRAGKTYYGNGVRAEHAAAQDRQRRRQRRDEQDAVTQLCVDVREGEVALTLYAERCRVLFEASMYAKGYHYHRGEWRRRGCLGRPRKHRQ